MNTAAFPGRTIFGTLTFDDNSGVAYLITASKGKRVQATLQWDPASTGTYDAAMIGKAYDYYKGAPGCFDGATIKVSRGCLVQGDTDWMLYVVKP